MREIIFDTETTGFDPLSGDRVIEIGCVEMVNKSLTGNNYHVYLNPRREVPESAVKVHGITTAMLADKPFFEDVVDEFLAYVGDDSILVAHNAEFDMKFINWEIENSSRKIISPKRFKDTLAMARVKFPGAGNSLDALCKRFGIENGHRTLHGALLDAEILADVYVELLGGRQAGLDLSVTRATTTIRRERTFREPRTFAPSDAELEAHNAFVGKLKDAIWLK